MKRPLNLAGILAQLFDNGPYTCLIHNAALVVSSHFFAPSGATLAQYYTSADRHAFAVAVQAQAKEDANAL